MSAAIEQARKTSRQVLEAFDAKLLQDVAAKVFPGGKSDIHRACIGGLFVGGSLQSVEGDGDGYTSYLDVYLTILTGIDQYGTQRGTSIPSLPVVRASLMTFVPPCPSGYLVTVPSGVPLLYAAPAEGLAATRLKGL